MNTQFRVSKSNFWKISIPKYEKESCALSLGKWKDLADNTSTDGFFQESFFRWVDFSSLFCPVMAADGEYIIVHFVSSIHDLKIGVIELVFK